MNCKLYKVGYLPKDSKYERYNFYLVTENGTILSVNPLFTTKFSNYRELCAVAQLTTKDELFGVK